ncbi:response regulator [Paenibacillus sediminis]|uniref:Two-component system response regulator YesN n=1 Tax=Paenibacillus sediminis TaxID=664909 RepID=A0ABS4H1A3_9BACL|nr:response regulator [Paenibacillus sediminis]MBP1936290.1 two-component system response regulator YesN [Paenibacillus sediminis]
MKENSATYRVMIVDDESILRTGIIHLCNWSEYNIEIVAQASNGQEALHLIDKVRPHVVITDIVMPIMDGVEFTKMMRMQYPDIKVVVLSSYSEFDYVREVFKYGVTDYLLKPKVSATELISLIQSLCGEMPPNRLDSPPMKLDPAIRLGQLLSTDRNFSEDIDYDWQEWREQFAGKHFRIVKASTGILLSKTHWTQAQIEQVIIELAQDHLSSCNYVCVFLKNECVVLVNYDTNQADDVQSCLDEFTRLAMKSLTYIKFVLSHEFENIAKIQAEHERLSPYLGKLIYFPKRHCIPEHEIKPETDKVNFDQAQFTSALRSLAIDDASVQSQALFAHIRSTQAYDEYSLKRLCQNIIYSAMSTLEQMKQPLSELSSSKLKLFKKIDLAFDLDELESVFIQFVDDLKAVVRQTDPQSMILHRIYEYVNQNYANDISLSELADKFHLNYSYLSSYFKQRTNENLTTFINRVRIDKAKELLQNYELSISQISQLTGFSDHNYFSKVFKKMTGMTPVEYRNYIYK